MILNAYLQKPFLLHNPPSVKNKIKKERKNKKEKKKRKKREKKEKQNKNEISSKLGGFHIANY